MRNIREYVATIKEEKSFIFITLKKPKLQGEKGVRIVNPTNNFIIQRRKVDERATPNKKIRFKNYQKRGVVGLKFKNQDPTLRISSPRRHPED